VVTLDAEIVKDLSRPMDFAIVDQIVKRFVRLQQVLPASKGLPVNPAWF